MRTLNSKLTTVIVATSILILAIFHEVVDFKDNQPGKSILITIPNGASGMQIGKLLESDGVIKSKSYFIEFYKNNKIAQSIPPGIHKLDTHVSTKTAVRQLLDQSRIMNSITIKEGSTYSDLLKLIRGDRNISFANFKTADLKIPIKNRLNSLEGQIYPAIYSFEPGTSAQSAIQSMLDRFGTYIDGGVLKEFGKYSKYDVLVIASLIQVEGDLKDFKKVARVIYNRLKANMPLQLNSTVQYAAGLRGQIALSKASTNIASPYNTYRNLGLPPTPIANPSSAAIAAAQNPETGDWLYFITVKPGDTRFTKSFSQFQDWNTLYNNNLANGLFK